MIRPCERLERFERRYARARALERTYDEALATFAGLWAEASLIRGDARPCWEEDVASDIVVARVLRGLPVDR